MAISPDGTMIALTESGSASGTGSSTTVLLFTLATKATAPFSAMGDSEPAFSPDGTKLAVTSTRYSADSPQVTLLGVPARRAPSTWTSGLGVNGQASFQPQH